LKTGDDKKSPRLTANGPRRAIEPNMKVRLSRNGETDYFGTGAASRFHQAQPLVLVALLTSLFALVLWHGNPKAAESIPQLQSAFSK
jgi:hypothetical protein